MIGLAVRGRAGFVYSALVATTVLCTPALAGAQTGAQVVQLSLYGSGLPLAPLDVVNPSAAELDS